MDARITKQRLSNMLSYDWIKIVITIVAAVVALAVFFTMVRTRPGEFQVFAVYAYTDLKSGGDSTDLAEKLQSGNVFSYDVLEVQSETFDTNGFYGEATYMARRTAGQGTAMFTTTRLTGNEALPEETFLARAAGTGDSCVALDLEIYLADCENYLKRFFSENWRTGPLDRAEAERCFLARNAKDKRYRSDEKKAAGILDEVSRLEKLRTDYLRLLEYLGNGTLSLVPLQDGADGEQMRAFGLGGLSRISRLYYYTRETDEGTTPDTAELCLFLFANDDDAGKPAEQVKNDLRFEPVSLLCYLAERYG